MCNTRLLLESEGVVGASMARIASMSNVSTKTLYNIFGSRNLLLLKVASERLHELILEDQIRMEVPGITKILATTQVAMEQFIHSPDFMRTVVAILVGADLDGSEPNRGQFQAIALESLLIAKQNHELRPATDIHELSRLLAANQWGMALMWEQEMLSLEQLVRQANLINIITLLPFCIGYRRDCLQELLDAQLSDTLLGQDHLPEKSNIDSVKHL